MKFGERTWDCSPGHAGVAVDLSVHRMTDEIGCLLMDKTNHFFDVNARNRINKIIPGDNSAP